jgi:hypothetical protein
LAVGAAGLFLVACLVCGCKDKKTTGDTAAENPPQPGGGEQVAYNGPHPAGRKVFEAHCMRCHAVSGQGVGFGGPGGPGRGGPGGPGGPEAGGGGGPGDRGFGGGPGGRGGMGRGPSLAHVGANHDAEWIAAHVRDPKTHKADSRMPAYGEDKINAADLKKLSEYLASLK